MSRKKPKDRSDKITSDHPFAEIIDDAYRVFAVPKPIATGVCENCCMDAEIEADFLNPPIEEMPLEYIRDWYFAACDPDLPKGIWAYLLPRVLEILAIEKDEDAIATGIEVSLSRYPTGQAENWTLAQWDVLDRFQRAYLDREMQRETYWIDHILCMFGQAGWPLDALFSQVMAYPDAHLAQRLWFDWCRGRFSIPIDAFWDNGRNTEAFAFYTSRVLYDRMAALMIAEDTPPDIVAKAADVASIIEANADWNRNA